MRRKDRNPVSDTFNIWAAFTDLMSNAFLVITLLLLLVINSVATHNSYPNSANNDKSAIVTISGKEYKFASAKADLPANLQKDILDENGENGKKLNEILGKINQLVNANKKVEVIEVIGHTDGREVGRLNCNNRQGSNLDKHLEKVAQNRENISILCPGSNADLGLMRALAVIKELQKAQNKTKDQRFKKLQWRAYSAAQLLLPDNRGFALPDKTDKVERRRIEIRFAQLD
ncbi:MAG: flagellar motor protein [Nostoc sp. NMS1]|uniref:flagellar motor protein n=1 Tax=unclassified Nostoc TaxID=2593658 RepID=UPI0025E62423|nr:MULTISPECIES: flagellar motor protein [unclassified Nostoc]MBN3905199.1 flagellar motor protein [Nostoc sp. NMS1]MBN3992694.1 flagellar motor protein [Nostoc sp. NMS2]